MSITVKDCFDLPSLSGGMVIAGKEGLDSIVTAVSVLEYDDGHHAGEVSSIASHNELLISAFYTIKDDAQIQCDSIRYFQSTGNVGLVLLYTGQVIKTVSQKLIDTANEINFPILVFPDNHHMIRYSDIISDVMESVINEGKRERNFTQNIMKIISNFPQKSRNLETLLQIICNQKKISLFLCDEQGLLISNGFWPLHTTLDYLYISPFLSQLTKVDKLTLHEDNLPVDLYNYPIKIDGSTFNLYIVDQSKSFNKGLLVEIEEILSLFTSIYHYHSFFHAKDTLIDALLRDDHYLINKLCKKDKINLSKMKKVIIYKIKTTSPLPLSEISEKFNSFPVFQAINKGCLVVLAPNSSTHPDLKKTLESALNDLNFVSFEHKLESINNFLSTYEALEISIPYLEKVFPNKKSFNEKDIEFALSLHEIIESGHNIVEEYLSIVKELSKEATDDLLETLSTYYLDAALEVKVTSQLLFVHRNTIQYRFQKIKKLLGYDFTKPPYLFNVYNSCALHRYLSM